MTAIYGFASKEDEFAFLAADNVAYDGKISKIDKIEIVDERFAIGTYGQELPKHAVSVLSYFKNTSNHCTSKSLGEIVNKLYLYTKQIAEHLYPQYLESKSVTKEAMDLCHNETANFVILDCRDFALYNIGIGSTFPPEKMTQPEVTKLEEAKLHKFALAENDVFDKATFMNDPCKTINDWFWRDNEHYQLCKSFYTQNELKLRNLENMLVGELGAHVFVSGNCIKYYSAFNDPSELINASFSRIIGYNISVLAVKKTN
jgi:hypothetical protein